MDLELEKLLEDARKGASAHGVESVIETNGGVFQMGDVFEAETVKGHKNYIVFFFRKGDVIYYVHGDRAKKVAASHFLKMIDYGDLVHVPRDKCEPERLSLAVLGLNAVANGMAFNDYLNVIYGAGERSEVR